MVRVVRVGYYFMPEKECFDRSLLWAGGGYYKVAPTTTPKGVERSKLSSRVFVIDAKHTAVAWPGNFIKMK